MDAARSWNGRMPSSGTRLGRGPRSERGAKGAPVTAGSNPGCHAFDPVKTQVLRFVGSARNDKTVRALHSKALELLRPGRRRVVLDLTGVTDADTKVVASLVDAIRHARATCVALDILVSTAVYAWISLCKVEQMLAPVRDDREGAS